MHDKRFGEDETNAIYDLFVRKNKPLVHEQYDFEFYRFAIWNNWFKKSRCIFAAKEISPTFDDLSKLNNKDTTFRGFKNIHFSKY